MITFFRRVREKLIASGSVSKYMLYAIGEILLVVIGILIALQVNNWNEERKERLLESELKEQLFTEFTRDLEQLEQKITIRNVLIHSASKLIEYRDQGSSAPEDSIAFYLSTTGYRPTFDPTSTQFIAQSDLSLIQNKQLKAYLTEWEVNVKQLTEDEYVWRDFRLNRRREVINGEGVARDIATIYNSNSGSSLFLIDGQEESSLPFDSPNVDIDYQSLLARTEVEDYLVYCILINKDANQNSFTLKERIETILELLKSTE